MAAQGSHRLGPPERKESTTTILLFSCSNRQTSVTVSRIHPPSAGANKKTATQDRVTVTLSFVLEVSFVYR